MQDLTPKQLKKLERVAKIADKGEVAYVEEFDAISDQLEALDTKIEGVLSVAEEARNKEVKDYVLTKADKKEIARSIEVPVVERIIEKTEVIRETPFVTKQVFETKIENEDSGEEIVGKINTQDTLIKSSRVEGFDLLKSRITNTGWGAHPLRIEANGVMKTKVARTLNFIGPTVVQNGSGVTDITVSNVTPRSCQLYGDFRSLYRQSTTWILVNLDKSPLSYPAGFTINSWSLDCSVDSPTTQILGDLMYCDGQAGGAFPGANPTLVVAIDSTAGNSGEASCSYVIPAGKILYLSFDANPTDYSTNWNLVVNFT